MTPYSIIIISLWEHSLSFSRDEGAARRTPFARWKFEGRHSACLRLRLHKQETSPIFSPSHSSVRIPARDSKRGMQVLSATGATDVKELRSAHAQERANLRIRKVPQRAESQDEHRAVCHRKSRNGSSAR